MTIGSLCSGYGGLELALGETPSWVAEIDPAASRILAHHWPTVPNLGDITKVDWAQVPRVDMLTAGYPCQPFSFAGIRRGIEDDRHVWPHIATAIRVLRPRRVFLENVTGHLSLGFGHVLADLAQLGFNAEWGCVRAADIGAPHSRNRVFILAVAADADGVQQ